MSDDSELSKWLRAMRDEFDSQIHTQNVNWTRDLIKKLSIGGVWIFKSEAIIVKRVSENTVSIIPDILLGKNRNYLNTIAYLREAGFEIMEIVK